LSPIKTIESKTNISTKISNEESYDDGSKNLANFFNGEIIDLMNKLNSSMKSFSPEYLFGENRHLYCYPRDY